jgi:hypothetical protein
MSENVALRRRITLETTITKKLIARLLSQWSNNLAINSGDDADDYAGRNRTKLVSACLGVDDCRVYLMNADGKTANGWVYLVYGNDGWDLISDYTTNLEDMLAPINTYCDSQQ